MKKTILMVFVLVAFVACKDQNSPGPIEETVIETVEQPIEEVILEAEEQATVLELDNGEKWEANIETTEGVATLTQLVQKFEVSDDINAYHALNDELQVVFKEIFDKCTMTGEGHEQLHNFLIPVHKQLTVLGEQDLEASKKSIAKLKEQLAVYPEYFK